MAFKKEVEIIIEPREIFVGKQDAPVTLMEFGEYENEDCAKANEIVKQLLEEYEGKVRFNFRHFPLTRIHQRSMKASEAAVAAAQEGKFWKCTMYYLAIVVTWEQPVLNYIQGKPGSATRNSWMTS